MEKHKIFLGITFTEIVILLILTFGSLETTQRKEQERVILSRQLVHSLELTDLALWTEARYTRHPSQADLFSAFQNSPAASDHFPAGVLIPPPWSSQKN